MRLSAELLGSSEQRTNPLGEREIILRGLAIPAIEHLGVTRDAFDVMDFSDNRLGRLENFPRLSRLNGLNVCGNVVESIDPSNLSKNVPNLKHMDLSYNQISSLSQVSNLGKACPKLEFLSLLGNPVTSKLSQVNLRIFPVFLHCLLVPPLPWVSASPFVRLCRRKCEWVDHGHSLWNIWGVLAAF